MSDASTRTSVTRCPLCGGLHPPGDPCVTPQGARAGTVLDSKYALVRLLGEGGMGEVYEARHTKIGRRLAVKFLHGQFAKRPEVARRFENEARAAGEVEHENIGGVYDVGALPDGTQYLVMEFLDGEDLDRVLKREIRIPLARAADFVIQACQGLDVVHRRGIVHRDLKPANLFLTKRANGTDLVKVLDFGIAKLRRPEGDASATETGMALGTAYYMSPEQARGARDIGPQSDVYALGVIFYELLSGRRPHDGTSLLQILHQILSQPPTPLEEVCPGLPPPVYQIVRTAMALSPGDRFAGVGALGEALAPFAGGVYRFTQPPTGELRMEATQIETSGVRAGLTPLSGGAPAQSVEAMAKSASAPAKRTRGIALGIGAVALVAIGVEAYVSVHARAARSAAAAEAAGVAGAASAAGNASGGAGVAAGGATVASAAAPATASAVATAAPTAAAAPVVPEATAPGSSGAAAGQDVAANAHAEDVAPSDGRRNHAVGGHSVSGSSHGSTHAPGAAVTAAQPPAPATSNKPDCRQTYTIDSDGNKHFRPECFGSR